MSNYMSDRTSTVSVQLDRQGQARLFRVLLSDLVGARTPPGRSRGLPTRGDQRAVEKVENDTTVVL